MNKKYWQRNYWRILCYHGIESCQVDSFRRQMTALLDMGLTPVSFESGFEYITSGKMSKPAFTVSFDDGSASIFLNALPILESLKISAFLYASADYLQQGRCYRDNPSPLALSWDQLREWRDGGHGVGSHTLTHANLKRCTSKVCLQELHDSKALLEDQLQQSIIHFSYPWGQHSNSTYHLLRSSGIYSSAATIDRGQMFTGHDPYILRRDVCDPTTSIKEMLNRMQLADNYIYHYLTRLRRVVLNVRRGK